MPRKHKIPLSVIQLKKLIGARVKERRAEISQEAIAEACGVDRGIISKIERGVTDYRINSLLRVIQAVSQDSEGVIFSSDPLEKALHDAVTRVYRAGIPSETQYLVDALRRAEDAINFYYSRSKPTALKPPRPA